MHVCLNQVELDLKFGLQAVPLMLLHDGVFLLIQG